jgi:DNA-binding transcriptional regulator YiaG
MSILSEPKPKHDLKRRVTRRLKGLGKEDWEAIVELAQLIQSATDKDKSEIIDAFREIVFPQTVFDGLDNEEPTEAEARKKLDAYRQKVGQEIRKRRMKLRMTQEELARQVAIPQSHVSRLESGKHAPTHVTMERLAKALKTRPKYLDPGFND